MKILALETSAKSVSTAVVENGAPLAYAYQCTGLTHSRTLMPMVDAMLKNAELTLGDMDAVAVAAGPGSFTGLRIGIAAVKGLAWAADKPCFGVSTLEAMAQNLAHMDGLLVCAMDARRNQVYNALFEAKSGVLTRLTPDRAIAVAELAEELRGETRSSRARRRRTALPRRARAARRRERAGSRAAALSERRRRRPRRGARHAGERAGACAGLPAHFAGRARAQRKITAGSNSKINI